MKIRIDLDGSESLAALLGLRAMFDQLVETKLNESRPELPPNLDIHSSHEPIDTAPTAVTVWTSKDGEPYVKDYINTADMAEIAETKTIEPKGCDGAGFGDEQKDTVKAVKAKLAEIKKTEAAKAKKVTEAEFAAEAKAKTKEEFAAKKAPADPRKIVEAVVGVKTETNEATGTIEEVREKLEAGSAISKETQGKIRKLNLQCAKYGKSEDAKAAVRERVGGPCKLSEIPAKDAASIITSLEAIAKGAEDNG